MFRYDLSLHQIFDKQLGVVYNGDRYDVETQMSLWGGGGGSCFRHSNFMYSACRVSKLLRKYKGGKFLNLNCGAASVGECERVI